MSVIKTLYRYLIGDMDGIVGKINQHRNTFESPSIENIPYKDIISQRLIDTLDTEPIAKFRGSVGIIYTANYQKSHIAIKVVSEITRQKITSETKALKFMGVFKSNFKSTVNDISQLLEKETDMSLEYKNCVMLNKHFHTNKYGIEFLKPIDELCSGNEFVYYFNNAVPIINMKNSCIINDICKRFVLFHIDLMHNHNILLGDVNIGNILYNEKTDKIVIIDYGCIITLNDNQKSFRTNLHLSQRNLESLTNLIKSWRGSEQFIDMLYKQGRPFFDMSGKKYDFGKINMSINLFDTSLLKLKLPTNSSLIIRACSQLSQFLKLMDITDNYAMDIYKIVDLNIKKY